MSAGFLLDGDDPVPYKKPSSNQLSPSTPTPVYIKVQVNNTFHLAIVDTGSCTTIIHKNLLSKIHHKKFIFKRKSYQSASCTSVDIIDEIELEIKINGHKTFIVADVATNLITNLLLGHVWFKQNRAIIDFFQQCITLNYPNKNAATTLILDFTELQHIALSIDEISIPLYSEQMIDIKVPAMMHHANRVVFQPTNRLRSKALFAVNAVVNIRNHQTQIGIINATDHVQIIPKNSRIGLISYQLSHTCLTFPYHFTRENIRSPNFFRREASRPHCHQCYVCFQRF